MSIKALAQGDFATKVPKLKNNDEFGRLLGNLETMRSDLGGLFQKIKGSSFKVEKNVQGSLEASKRFLSQLKKLKVEL